MNKIHGAERIGQDDGFNFGESFNPYNKDTDYRLWLAYNLGFESGLEERNRDNE